MSRTPASIGHHPLHAMLIAFPLGLWIFSFVCDIIFFATGRHSPWDVVAFYAMVGGIVGAALAAVPGFIDWLSIKPASRAKKIGVVHMTLNVVALVLYILNVLWRMKEPDLAAGPFVLSFIIILMLGVSGWLGGALVYEERIGVNERP